jgi:putative endonuclease
MGVRGETYAYWYLRRLGYIFIARNYMPLRVKGELDLIGYDGDTLAIVEVRTRRALKGQPALPEMSITKEKHEVLVRTAHYFQRDRHIQNCPLRFDVVAIENTPASRQSYACTKRLSAGNYRRVSNRKTTSIPRLTSIEGGEEYNTIP